MLKLWVIVLEGPGLNAATAARSPGGTELACEGFRSFRVFSGGARALEDIQKV